MSEETKDSETQKKRSSWTILKLLFALLVLLFVSVVLLIIFPAPVLRLAFDRLKVKEGIVVTFEKAYFDLGKHALALENVSAQRQNHHNSNFNIQAKVVHIDIPPQADHPNAAAFLTISGLSGTYERVGKDAPDEKNNENNTRTKNSFRKKYKPLILVTNSQIAFVDKTLERPFQGTIQIEIHDAILSYTDAESMFGTYSVRSTGLINTDSFFHIAANEAHLQSVPLELLSPYVPILNDIFVAGSVSIDVNDLTNEEQKSVLVKVFLQKDCRIKSADEILAPAVQTALRKLDHSSVTSLQELRTKIGNLQAFSDSLRREIDKIAPIVEALKMLAPPDVRAKYEQFKSQYERLRNAPAEWNEKLETLLRDLDQAKAGIVNDTFQHFIATQTPIEFYAYEEKGRWQCDWDAVLVRLLEQNFQTLIADVYQKRIQEMLDSVNRLLVP